MRATATAKLLLSFNMESLDLPFNMESLYEFIEQLRQGDRMFVIDITSAHHRPSLVDSDHLHLHVARAL